MKRTDRILETIDRGLATAPSLDPGYNTDLGTHVCWRCQVNEPGEGASGVCDACRSVLLDETNEPEPANTVADAPTGWVPVGSLDPGTPSSLHGSRFFRAGPAHVYVGRMTRNDVTFHWSRDDEDEAVENPNDAGHRLMADAIAAQLRMQRAAVHHIDGNPANNDPANLEIVDDPSQNAGERDAVITAARQLAERTGVSTVNARESLQHVLNAYREASEAIRRGDVGPF